MREIDVESPLVDAFALPDREHVQLVRVVRDDDHACVCRRPVDRDAEPARLPEQHPQGPQPSERDVLVLFVNEPRVEPQRDVVQEEPVVDAADVDAISRPENAP